ncbi:hypothetical protein FRACYDRAFT_257324 [Fragilariopsis cylindrus CCMP1102]|uniref:Serine aminopeptidase S33 domain-containing protein n=1 Tax=Fragilariopsis cylindrus CCMP1102 TaxID=635003 RepID=A0A1E7EJ91_9STRA|nr:hypothetical protein FRACYDRAFT_257324 [Fragilariopsis cylindrus CCMP1102]|eukprot:OEU05940.1 hypothetical protein FRACYDRAFT_257324 [Fragilariopsis cylindrus CCMP1102]
MESNKMINTNDQQSLDDLLIYEELAFTIQPSSNTNNNTNNNNNTFGEDEKESNNRDDDDDDESLITAVARAPFFFNDDGGSGDGGGYRFGDCLLNVELFGFDVDDDDNSKNNNITNNTDNNCSNVNNGGGGILCFVHGVCESAETWTVQNLARICQKQKWKLAVLELEGHGLSFETRGLLNVGKMNRYVQQVVQFYKHVIKIDSIIQEKQQKQKQKNQNDDIAVPTKFALCGSSLGGTLAAYASQQIMEEVEEEKEEEEEKQHQFVGTLLISPAVGIDPKVVPSSFILSTLSILSLVIPSIGFMTPIEDPSHYNCPSTTKRNYAGSWPLGTSKLLLDITSIIVPNDIQNGTLNLMMVRRNKKKKQQYNTVVPTTIMIISGDKDPVVPIEAVRNFVSTMMTQNQEQEQEEQREKSTTTTTTSSNNIELIEINKGDHGLLAQSVNDKRISKTKKNSTNTTIEQIISFLKRI